MFGLPGTSLPYRNNKDLARAQRLRGFTRRRTPGPSIEDVYMPNTNPWQRNPYAYASPLSSRFEELGDEPLPVRSTTSSNSNSSGYGNTFPKDSKRRPEYPRERSPVPFDKAADALCQALEYASKHFRGIKEHFEREVSPIAYWAPQKAIDALWTMKADWDGIDLTTRERSSYQQPASNVTTFKAVVERLTEALRNMKMCGRPRGDWTEQQRQEVSPEVFRYTMNKLEVTLNGIGELVQSVRKDRRLVEPLVKDLISATALLRDVEESWSPRRKSSSGYQARAESQEEDYAWSW
ncbi:hypothetical protein LTR17_002617 [Elasticomyces elasticus]|nr:hypothetical protein LTR17_002617 [Elasticomyces elasticus]